MAKPIYTPAQIVDQIEGVTWAGGDIEYAIPSQQHPDPGEDEHGGFWGIMHVPYTPYLAQAREAFELWDDLIARNLNEADLSQGNGWDANITFAYSYTTKDGRTYEKEVGEQHQVWINSYDSLNYEVEYSEFGFTTYLHEIGHALGLAHPGPYSSTDPEHPGEDYGKEAMYTQDTLQYTVMSYFNAGADGGGTDHVIGKDGDFAFAATPLLHDILTVQHAYGADLETRTGNTVYGFNNTSGRGAFDFNLNKNPVVAIWDAGGSDTLDLSGYATRQQVNLNPGTFSSISDSGLTNNLALAYAVDGAGRIEGLDAGFDPNGIVNYIENAIGGSGNDFIVGNAASNNLEGRAGDDQLFGLAGIDNLFGGRGHDYLAGGAGADSLYGGDANDLLDGGEDRDILLGGEGDDTYMIDLNSDGSLDQVVEFAPEVPGSAGGIDTIITRFLADYTLADGLENLIFAENIYDAPLDRTGTGNSAANAITGASGNDTLRGLGGNDVLDGRAGSDVMEGGYGDDTYYVDNWDDQVIEAPTIYLHLGTTDTGMGLDGVGFSVGGTKKNELPHVIGGGTDEVRTTLPYYALDTLLENLTYLGDTSFTGIGNASNNVITGGVLGDWLDGGDGNDTLIGGAGADTMRGGKGNDIYHVDDAGDRIDESFTLFHPKFGEIDYGDLGGIDEVRTTLSSYSLGSTVENLSYVGHLNFTGYGNELANVIKGGAGDDTLLGRAGDDTLDGTFGNDFMSGGAGNDIYYVDSDQDRLSEIWTFKNPLTGEALHFDTGGVDEVRALISLYVLGDNVENLRYVGDGRFTGIGNDLDNAITGGELEDILGGGDGGDYLVGRAGDDLLFGHAGTDWIEGGDGNDKLYGGEDADVLFGGAGLDTFVVQVDESADYVADFEAGEYIDLTLRFEAAGIAGMGFDEAVAAGYLSIVDDGATNAVIRFDMDGGGGDWQTVLTVASTDPATLGKWNFAV